jgi:hypothetical protein
MIFLAKRCSILSLLSLACVIGSAKAQAQSREADHKRSFAELLARRAKAPRAESHRAIAGTPHTASRTAQTTRLARSTDVIPRIAPSTSPLLATVSPLAASATGISSATPTIPSGHGPGRDAFVEDLYPLILGREPHQSELDYWSGVLARGVAPTIVARSIWNSQEHRSLVRTHKVPPISFETAYRKALIYSQTHRYR